MGGGGVGDLVGDGLAASLLGEVGGDSDLVDLAGELVTELEHDEELTPPLNKLSVFLPAIQWVSKCWYKFSITFALR